MISAPSCTPQCPLFPVLKLEIIRTLFSEVSLNQQVQLICCRSNIEEFIIGNLVSHRDI